MVGLGNVNNTSDAAKPVSTAQQTALNLKADLAGTNTWTNAQRFPNIGVGNAAVAGIAITGRVATAETVLGFDNGSNSGFVVKFASGLTTFGNDFGAPLAFITNNTERVRIDVNGNVLVANTASAPAAPASGGVFYVEAGALKYRGSGGTITTVAPA
jgi:hypothetical protein